MYKINYEVVEGYRGLIQGESIMKGDLYFDDHDNSWVTVDGHFEEGTDFSPDVSPSPLYLRRVI